MDKILQLITLMWLSTNCTSTDSGSVVNEKDFMKRATNCTSTDSGSVVNEKDFMKRATNCTSTDSSPVVNEKDFMKREFRAVWVVTLDNKDFPSRAGLSTKNQQESIIQMLDFYQKKGINAIVFQVRPSADAFYNSPYEPWSEWLTGRQGEPPVPFYDPLTFMIEECHKRNMELHAWFNPYRAVLSKNSNICSRHISQLKPHWVIAYGGAKQLDPGIPEVRSYIQSIVLDVVKRYDIDGVHFDDYFYPYKVGTQEFPDEATYTLYKGNFSNKNDWRRENINVLIKGLSENITKLKPHVKFGVSPLGVWRNQKDDPRGSATAVGQTCYDYLGADILKWLEKGWIDYVAPQMYWSIGHERADYKVLAEWWAKNSYRRHVYVGQASYKAVMKESDKRWTNRAELSNQMRLNRKHNLQGSIFFRSKPLMRSWVSDTLYKQFFRYQALMPTMPWKDSIAPLPPEKVKIVRSQQRVMLKWQSPLPAPDGQTAHYYAIYKAPLNETIDLQNPKHFLLLQKNTDWTEKVGDKEAVHYCITALDRLHNESKPVEVHSFSGEDF